MALINGTAHQVFIYNAADCMTHPTKRGAYLRNGAEPVLVIGSGVNLNVYQEDGVRVKRDGITYVTRSQFVDADGIPGDKSDVVFCSNFYRAGCVELGWDTSRLATPKGPVYEDASAARPCGVTALEVG